MSQCKNVTGRDTAYSLFHLAKFTGDLSRFFCLALGDRYVVVDCGGGTVDLTVHQIRLPEGHLKELYKASGTSLNYILKKLDFFVDAIE